MSWEWAPGRGWTDTTELEPLPPVAELLAEAQPVLAAGLDYSAGRIPGSTVIAAGFDFCIRYVDAPSLVRTKHISPTEYADLTGAGVRVYLVFEQNTSDMLGGYAAGVTNAKRALAGAEWIGYPGLIFMACDMHLTASQIPTAHSYLDGAATILGYDRLGCYGFWELIDAAIAVDQCAAYWQCGVPPAPTDPVHVWQVQPPAGSAVVGGIACDINHLLRPLPGSDDVLTPDQDARLTACYQFVTGSADVIPQDTSWPGWPTWPDGTNEHLTATDYLRRANEQLVAVQQLLTQPATSTGPATLTAEDVNRIAAAVAVLLGTRLQQPSP